MEGKLKVSTAKLTSTATSFGNRANRMNALTQDMFSTVKSMSGDIWSGEAANQYVQKFSGLSKDVERLSKMIQEHVKDLQDMAQKYEAAENVAKNAAESLKASVID